MKTEASDHVSFQIKWTAALLQLTGFPFTIVFMDAPEGNWRAAALHFQAVTLYYVESFEIRPKFYSLSAEREHVALVESMCICATLCNFCVTWSWLGLSHIFNLVTVHAQLSIAWWDRQYPVHGRKIRSHSTPPTGFLY